MPFAKVFEPVAKPRENIRLVPGNIFYRVEFIEPVFGLIIDLGTVSAGSETNLYEVRQLDLDPLTLGQWRIFLLDDFNLTVNQPRAAERGTTKSQSTKISMYTIALDPDLKTTEFFTFEDKTRVYFKAENPTNYDVDARILILGWKLFLEEIQEAAKWTDVPIAVVTRARK